jgi:hypothetical protein
MKKLKTLNGRDQTMFKNYDLMNVSGNIEITFDDDGKPYAIANVVGVTLTIFDLVGRPLTKLQAVVNPYTGRLVWAPCSANGLSISADARSSLPLLSTLRYRFGDPHIPTYGKAVVSNVSSY